ncbi:MAG: hypothetical protein AB1489_39090 [Acidobacteriota bacterium]
MIAATEPVKYTINYCKKAFTNRWALSCAIHFAELLEAEEDKIISTAWRKEMDVDKLNLFISSNLTTISKEWQEDFRRLKRIIDYGGKFEFEETLLVLMLRSELELALRFLGSEHRELLMQMDETFIESLKENTTTVVQCQTHKKVGLAHKLSSHWWWHS